MQIDHLATAVAERVQERVDPVTGRLRAAECAVTYQAIALELGISWAAVWLRVPKEMLPTEVEIDAYKRLLAEQPQIVCQFMGCNRCPACAQSEIDLARFTDAELRAAHAHATVLGGLPYDYVQTELWRRRRRTMW